MSENLPNPSDVIGQVSTLVSKLSPKERLVGSLLVIILVLLPTVIPFVPEQARVLTWFATILSILLVFLLLRLRENRFQNIAKENRELKNGRSQLDEKIQLLREEQLNLIRWGRRNLSHAEVEVSHINIQMGNLLPLKENSEAQAREISEKLTSLAESLKMRLEEIDSRITQMSAAKELDEVNDSFEKRLANIVDQSKLDQLKKSSG